MKVFDLSTKDIRKEIPADNQEQAFIKFFQFIDEHNLWEKLGGIVNLKERGKEETYPMRTHTVAYLMNRLTKQECMDGIIKMVGQTFTEKEFDEMCNKDKWILK